MMRGSDAAGAAEDSVSTATCVNTSGASAACLVFRNVMRCEG